MGYNEILFRRGRHRVTSSVAKEIAAFNNDTDSRSRRPMIETRLLRCLRTWRITTNAAVENDNTLFQEIFGLLEFYICGCIAYDPKQLGGWWSDGVIHLEIAEPEPGRFTLLGVTWIGSLGIAPFEIDLKLDPNDDTYFAKTVFRIGMLDKHGHPTVSNRNTAPTRVLETRPQYNRDWAMAVELTPPPKHATEQSGEREPPVTRVLKS